MNTEDNMNTTNPDALMEEIAKIERFWKDLDPSDFELVEADGSTRDDPDVEAWRQTERQSREDVRTAMLKHVGLQKKALRTLFQDKIRPKILTVLEDATAIVRKTAIAVDQADGEFKKTLAALKTTYGKNDALEKVAKLAAEFEKDAAYVHDFAERLRDLEEKSQETPLAKRIGLEKKSQETPLAKRIRTGVADE
jgi:hypothetical protein